MAVAAGDVVGFRDDWGVGAADDEEFQLFPHPPLRGYAIAVGGGAASVVFQGATGQVAATAADIPEVQLAILKTKAINEDETKQFLGQTVEPNPSATPFPIPGNVRSALRGRCLWVLERERGDNPAQTGQIMLVKTLDGLYYVAPQSLMRVVDNG